MPVFGGFGRLGLQLYPAWTDRIATGALPKAPPRPHGIERNLVVSMWGQGSVSGFVHVLAAGGKSNALVPPNTFIYSPSQSNDMLYWGDENI
jgi:hypothetical protein